MSAVAGTAFISVLSRLSLVATVVEFAYVIRLRSIFTPFEKLFFLSAGISEMVGELFLVSAMLVWLYLREKAARSSHHRDGTFRGDIQTASREQVEGYRTVSGLSGAPGGATNGAGLSVAKARAHLDKLSQDPIHVLKDTVSEYFAIPEEESSAAGEEAAVEEGVPGESEEHVGIGSPTATGDIDQTRRLLTSTVLVAVSLVLTFSPTLVFGFVLVVLRSFCHFKSPGDEGVMWSLTVVSIMAFFSLLFFVLYLLRRGIRLPSLTLDDRNAYIVLDEAGERGDAACLKWTLRFAVIGGALIYSIEKVYELFLLMWRSDRLAPGALGQSLIVFQMVELVSVANIVYYFLLDHFFGDGVDEPSPPDQLSRIESMLVELRDNIAGIQDANAAGISSSRVAASDGDRDRDGDGARMAVAGLERQHALLVVVDKKLDALAETYMGVTERLGKLDRHVVGQRDQEGELSSNQSHESKE